MMEMDFTTCCIINAPLIVLNITVNLFFMFCMICPLASGDEIKQPLKLLLWSIICSTISYLLSLTAALLSDEHSFAPHVVTVYAFATCMTSSAWLNFFYCTQIIPAQQTLFIWIKKNVKSIIYCIWTCERLLWLFEMTIVLLHGFDMDEPSNFIFSNTTSSRLQGITTISFMISMAYFVLCLCVMVGSSGATVVYLCRHMRGMVTNGSPFFGPRFRSQARVTITGVLQGVVHLFCSVLIMSKWFNEAFGGDNISNCPPYTFVSIFMSCTTFNLGVGQAVFRMRTASMWLRAAQWCKTCNAQSATV